MRWPQRVLAPLCFLCKCYPSMQMDAVTRTASRTRLEPAGTALSSGCARLGSARIVGVRCYIWSDKD